MIIPVRGCGRGTSALLFPGPYNAVKATCNWGWVSLANFSLHKTLFSRTVRSDVFRSIMSASLLMAVCACIIYFIFIL